MPMISSQAARTICALFDGLVGDDTVDLDKRRAAVKRTCKRADVKPEALHTAIDMMHEAANLPWPDPRIYED